MKKRQQTASKVFGRGLLNAENPKLLTGLEIYRIWVMQCTKQEFAFEIKHRQGI